MNAINSRSIPFTYFSNIVTTFKINKDSTQHHERNHLNIIRDFDKSTTSIRK